MMLHKLFSVLKGLASPAGETSQAPGAFVSDQDTGLRRRVYGSYEDYVQHQRAKLSLKLNDIARYDVEYEEIVSSRYRELVPLQGRRVLCLAARLGGEVRAFKSLGALAIGIDLEPGPDNEHVLHGDFHQIAFPDRSFDVAFTNALDHVLELHQLLAEVRRVLDHQGLFLVELADVQPSSYEVLDVKNVGTIEAIFSEGFVIEQKVPVENKTSYANWGGSLYFLRRREAK